MKDVEKYLFINIIEISILSILFVWIRVIGNFFVFFVKDFLRSGIGCGFIFFMFMRSIGFIR